MTRHLAALLLFPAVLAAQQPRRPRPPAAGRPDSLAAEARERAASRGWIVGITGYTGGMWQPSGIDLGYLWRFGRPAGQVLSGGVRVGSFVQDQAVLVGGTTGLFATLVATVKRPLLDLALVGTERNPTVVRLEAAVESDLSLNLNSPLPQGGAHVAGALLGGVTIGGPRSLDQSFGLFVGPAYFLGKTGSWHTQISLRFQAPLSR